MFSVMGSAAHALLFPGYESLKKKMNVNYLDFMYLLF